MNFNYRKKPVIIQAFQTTKLWAKDAHYPMWFVEAVLQGKAYSQGGPEPYWTIETLEGNHRADIGDWIIQGVKGEIYPCKPDIFSLTYDSVELDDGKTYS